MRKQVFSTRNLQQNTGSVLAKYDSPKNESFMHNFSFTRLNVKMLKLSFFFLFFFLVVGYYSVKTNKQSNKQKQMSTFF